MPEGDKNIILSFHYYHPMPVTHRFAGWTPAGKYERDLAYAWTKDMIEVFDKFDIAWTTWCYDGDFGFYSQKTESITDQGLVDILTSGQGVK